MPGNLRSNPKRLTRGRKSSKHTIPSVLMKGNGMADISTSVPPRTIAVLSRQYLIWLGFRSVIECAALPQVVMHPYRRTTSELLGVGQCPDVVILDLETVRHPIGAIKQIRESAPSGKIVLLSGVDDTQPLREVTAYGVDGVMLTSQPPEVVLAMLRSLYPRARTRGQAAHHEAVARRREMYKQKLNSECSSPTGQMR